MRTDRIFLGVASWAIAALIIGSQPRVAFAEPATELVVHNDYGEPIKIDLFHPQAINRVFATWSLDGSEKTRFDLSGEPVRVQSDWGIRVRFRNGARSDVMRLLEVGGGNVTASSICSYPHISYPMEGRKITKIDGYTIDPQFGPAESRLLKDALAIFYERFLQYHPAGCPELCTRTAYKWEAINRSHFKSAEDSRDIIEVQRSRLSMNNSLGKAFPHVELEYANVDEDWLAKAHVGIVKISPGIEDEEAGPYPVTGTFKILINDFYLNNASKYRHYSSPAYWAGVIAHEALHNLGHRHAQSRDDPQYYRYQMIIIEHLVMKGGMVRYGDLNPTPVLCRKRE